MKSTRQRDDGGKSVAIARGRFAKVVTIDRFMQSKITEFLESLNGEASPAPPDALLTAVWHGLRGEWDAAHEIAQEDESAEGSWVHAWLHRTEGDLSNAGYWYRRAQREVEGGDIRAEGETIAAFLLSR